MSHTIRPTQEEMAQATAPEAPHLDLPERDEQTLLELGVEAEQLRGPPEVAAGGGERVHRGGNVFFSPPQEEGSRGRAATKKTPPFQHRRQKQQARARRGRDPGDPKTAGDETG